MEARQTQQSLCNSVFKSGENMTKARFTKKWTQQINQIEKNGCIARKEREA